MSIIVRMLDKAQMKVGMRVCVCGGGPIGLMALQAFHLYGATSLTMIEPIADRREIAAEMGAEYLIDPTAENVVDAANKITDGRGYDVVLDCSGSVHAVEPLPDITAKGGTLIYGRPSIPETTGCLLISRSTAISKKLQLQVLW